MVPNRATLFTLRRCLPFRPLILPPPTGIRRRSSPRRNGSASCHLGNHRL